MALVRRTDKLRDALTNEINEIRENKMAAYLRREKVQQDYADLLQACYHEDLIYPLHMRDWFEQRTPEELNLMAHADIPQFRVRVIRPCESSWKGYDSKVYVLPKIKDFPVLPPIRGQAFGLVSDDEQVVVGFSNWGEENTFAINFKVPDYIRKKKGDVYEFETRLAPKKMGSEGIWEWTFQSHPDDDRSPQFRKFVAGSNKDSEFMPPKIQVPFNAMVEHHQHLIAIDDRYQKTLSYIFGELWKLPSLNKMAEFFPAIKAFLPAETLEQLNKGARNKKEYNVALPDAEIIVSATEASIK